MRRGAAAVVAAAVLAGVALAGCGDEGGARTPRSPGTTLEGAERCAGIPADQQREEPIEVIHAFGGDDGANPWGSLVLLQDQLYGRTRVGGEFDNGVVFRVGLEGGYEVLRSFTAGADNGEGNQPHHDWMNPVSGLLYSNTLHGGQGDDGVLFALDPQTGEERVIHEFAGAPGDGAQAHSGYLVTSRGMWILTAKGGAHDQGALVRLEPETGATELAYSFSGPDGSDPHGRLVRSGEKMLYGMTRSGGSDDAGVIFSFDPDSREYRVIHEFGPGPANGEQPDHGFLYEGAASDERLWGLTTLGGAHGQGVLFSIEVDGSNFEVHHAFGSTPTDAAHPHASLQWAAGHFYGLSFEGGRWGVGSVFRIKDDGSDFQVLASFGGSETGAFPYDNVLALGRKDRPPVLYGMTGNGGPNDPDCQQALGVIFRLDLERLAG